MNAVAFVPIKLNSRRLEGKNVRDLAGRPLLAWMLETLAELCRQEVVSAAYAFCSSDIRRVLPPEVSYLQRDPVLDGDEVLGNDLCTAFAQAVPADVYCNCFATTPFLSSRSIAQCVRAVGSGEFDSAVTVRKQHFAWYRGRPIDYDPVRVGRTQDLEPVWVESLMYCYRDDVVRAGRRVGDRPWLQEINAIEAIDIDDETDFRLAEAVAKSGLYRER